MTEFKGTREAFAAAVMDMAETDERIVVVSPDSLKAMRAVPFGEKYPSRYVECGIAEQCAVDVAAGLASCGLIPFVGTYCGFLTMRACEQMRTFVGYTELNAKFVGVNAGLLGGEREGVTHQFYEDIGILASIPNFTILTPADPAQCYHAVRLAAEIDGPVYVRAGSGREKNVYDKNAPFSTDGITVWKEYGTDAILLSNGFVLDRVLAAAELLKEQGILVTAADVNILYGKRQDQILEVISRSNQLFTVEDHNINGGLGSYISRLVCENNPAMVHRIALTGYGESGPAEPLADNYGFSPQSIAQTVRSTLNR
ncbi:transketolase family protein [Faecalispora jeddahensis]|uniref:transketolase family protein n=1 Tax=Faecalispora jeddahensis TaxID=1414721 RepID=UPI00189B10F4|nr:transketolase C-terminal domain-containing protein [Faecalispora jeddahensis]